MTGVKDIAEGKIGKVLGAEKSKLKGGISIDLFCTFILLIALTL
jgi:hypothetical protein